MSALPPGVLVGVAAELQQLRRPAQPRPVRTTAPTGSAPSRAAVPSSGRTIFGRHPAHALLALVWLVVAAATLLWGIDYYVIPLPDRPYSALHETLKPSGLIGLGYGIVGALMVFIGVSTYSLRKRIRFLARVGKLRNWLTFHIFLCTLGPYLVLLHTSFKFGGIVSIGFWAMMTIALSGLFGRYVYVRIPKAINGHFLSLQAIEQEQRQLLATIALRSGLAQTDVTEIERVARRRTVDMFLAALVLSFWYDLTAGSHRRKIQRLLARKGVPPKTRAGVARLFLEEIELQQQIALRKPFLQIFKFWHLFHVPLSIVVLLVILLHVGVAVALGYTWIF
ncbi:MAG: hypothetical protein OER90_19980 [Gemmatimonadota bacterium]|nr:hypothetical protein [Gemmatimonadota bacterium]